MYDRLMAVGFDANRKVSRMQYDRSVTGSITKAFREAAVSYIFIAIVPS